MNGEGGVSKKDGGKRKMMEDVDEESIFVAKCVLWGVSALTTFLGIALIMYPAGWGFLAVSVMAWATILYLSPDLREALMKTKMEKSKNEK